MPSTIAESRSGVKQEEIIYSKQEEIIYSQKILSTPSLGGMRVVTWTQVAQNIILIIAYITPVAFLSVKHFGVSLPEFTYGQVLSEITAIEVPLKAAGEVKKLWVELSPGGMLNWFA